jgi:hypothetical protein
MNSSSRVLGALNVAQFSGVMGWERQQINKLINLVTKHPLLGAFVQSRDPQRFMDEFFKAMDEKNAVFQAYEGLVHAVGHGKPGGHKNRHRCPTCAYSLKRRWISRAVEFLDTLMPGGFNPRTLMEEPDDTADIFDTVLSKLRMSESAEATDLLDFYAWLKVQEERASNVHGGSGDALVSTEDSRMAISEMVKDLCSVVLAIDLAAKIYPSYSEARQKTAQFAKLMADLLTDSHKVDLDAMSTAMDGIVAGYIRLVHGEAEPETLLARSALLEYCDAVDSHVLRDVVSLSIHEWQNAPTNAVAEFTEHVLMFGALLRQFSEATQAITETETGIQDALQSRDSQRLTALSARFASATDEHGVARHRLRAAAQMLRTDSISHLPIYTQSVAMIDGIMTRIDQGAAIHIPPSFAPGQQHADVAERFAVQIAQLVATGVSVASAAGQRAVRGGSDSPSAAVAMLDTPLASPHHQSPPKEHVNAATNLEHPLKATPTAPDVRHAGDINSVAKESPHAVDPAPSVLTVVEIVPTTSVTGGNADEPIKTDVAEPESIAPAPNGDTTIEGFLTACAENHFDLAFWLSWLTQRHGVGNWNHDAFSTFVFGSRVSPDGFVGGELADSLDRQQDAPPLDEPAKMLVASGLLAPILFCATKPGSVYALRTGLSTNAPKFDEFFEKVADIGLSKTISLTQYDVQLAGQSTDHMAARKALQAEATQELYRTQHSKITFWPAEVLLHALYREGWPLNTLHAIVEADDASRLNEAKELLQGIDPEQLTGNYELAPGLVPGRCPQMVGPARVKFLRFINTTLSLARRWIERVEASGGSVDNFRRKQIEDLRDYVKKNVQHVLKELHEQRGRDPRKDAALSAATYVVKRLAAMLAGEVPNPQPDIYTMLVGHPGVALDDDFMPANGAEDGLVEMLEQRRKPSAEEAFRAALARGEFVRAKYLVEHAELDDKRRAELLDVSDEAFHRLCSEIAAQIEDLETQVEDAFLLGELAEFHEDEQGLDVAPSQHAVRSDLLNKLQEARTAVDAVRTADERRLQHIVQKVTNVSRFIAGIKERAHSRLQAQCDAIAKAFPDSTEGKEDLDYFLVQFARSLGCGDQVAASEMIHQAQTSLRENNRLALTRIDSCDIVRQFEEAEPQLQAALEEGALEGLKIALKSHQEWGGVNFADLDKDQAVRAIELVESIERVQGRSPVEQIGAWLSRLLAAVGLEPDGQLRNRSGTAQYRHFEASLRFTPPCPVPAFGTGLRRKLTVLVLFGKRTDEELYEQITNLNLKRTPLLVVSPQPISMAQRHKVRAMCAHHNIELLMLDLSALLFILSKRSRLAALFGVLLPFAYTQPYQEKGENVPDECFVGRSKEVNSLLSKDGACIVFGGRQLGKTATLRHIVNRYHDPAAHHYILYKDIDDLGAAGDAGDYDNTRYTFWSIVAVELSNAGFPNLADLDGKGKYRTLESAVMASVKELFSRHPDARLTLLLDEADDLIDLDAQHDFGLIKTIRQLMVETNRQFKAVFAGLESIQRYQRWKNHPFAQLGREIVIGPLPTIDAHRLIVGPLAALGFEFESPELVLRIMSAVNYHPGLLQIFCHRLLTRCFDKLARQKKSMSAIRVITREDLREVERHRGLAEDIMSRFDWTLDLDDRYKVLTYALVISGNPTLPRSDAEFVKLGADWWGAEFASMDAASIRSLLEEMEGLGVLVRVDQHGVRTYQLRSPNLLRLLGDRDTIETELVRIAGQPSRRKAIPREFHTLKSAGKEFFVSPMTFGQDASLFNRHETVGMTLVFGSDALGARDVEAGIQRVAEEVRETDGWVGKTFGLQFCTTADRFVGELVQIFRPRDRHHLYTVVPLDLMTRDTPVLDVLQHIHTSIRGTCTKTSRGQVFLLAGPQTLWKYLVERRMQSAPLPPTLTEMVLAPWSDGGLWKGMEAAGVRTKAKQVSSDVLDLTGGFHFLVKALLADCKARNVQNADEDLPKMRKRIDEVFPANWHDLFGFGDLTPALRVAAESMFPAVIEREGGIAYVTRAGVLDVLSTLESSDVAAAFGDIGRDVAVEILVQWMTMVGLLRGSNEQDSFLVPNLVAARCLKS